MNQAAEDLAFIRELRQSALQYVRAIDFWETEYQKFCRMPRTKRSVSNELQRAQREYVVARRELSARIPRARQLSIRYGVRDIWAGLIRTSPSTHHPQQRPVSAIGRNERSSIEDALSQMEEACLRRVSRGDDEAPEERVTGLLRRIRDFFT